MSNEEKKKKEEQPSDYILALRARVVLARNAKLHRALSDARLAVESAADRMETVGSMIQPDTEEMRHIMTHPHFKGCRFKTTCDKTDYYLEIDFGEQ